MMEQIRTILSDVPCPAGGIDVNDLLRLSLDIGEEMLKDGGEVHRVETTVEHLCRAYGAEHVEVFAIPSLIIASVRMKDNRFSLQIRRVYDSSNQLRKLEAMNRISRRICRETPSLGEVEELIREAKRTELNPKWLLFLGYALTAAAFAVFFGGSWKDGIAGAVVGLLLAAVGQFRSRRINPMGMSVILSFFAGVVSYLLVWSGIGQNADKIMIGSIMLLIPGISLGNAIRDMLCGDMMAGILKFVQSLITAALIALGFFLAILLMGGAL